MSASGVVAAPLSYPVNHALLLLSYTMLHLYITAPPTETPQPDTEPTDNG